MSLYKTNINKFPKVILEESDELLKNSTYKSSVITAHSVTYEFDDNNRKITTTLNFNNSGNLINYHCTCDKHSLCKHVGAVLKILDTVSEGDNKPDLDLYEANRELNISYNISFQTNGLEMLLKKYIDKYNQRSIIDYIVEMSTNYYAKGWVPFYENLFLLIGNVKKDNPLISFYKNLLYFFNDYYLHYQTINSSFFMKRAFNNLFVDGTDCFYNSTVPTDVLLEIYKRGKKLSREFSYYFKYSIHTHFVTTENLDDELCELYYQAYLKNNALLLPKALSGHFLSSLKRLKPELTNIELFKIAKFFYKNVAESDKTQDYYLLQDLEKHEDLLDILEDYFALEVKTNLKEAKMLYSILSTESQQSIGDKLVKKLDPITFFQLDPNERTLGRTLSSIEQITYSDAWKLYYASNQNNVVLKKLKNVNFVIGCIQTDHDFYSTINGINLFLDIKGNENIFSFVRDEILKNESMKRFLTTDIDEDKFKFMLSFNLVEELGFIEI